MTILGTHPGALPHAGLLRTVSVTTKLSLEWQVIATVLGSAIVRIPSIERMMYSTMSSAAYKEAGLHKGVI
jgi:hypothetical protein